MDNIIIRNRKEEFKELVLYTFFGNMTFVISIGSYAIFNVFFGINELIANALAWVFAVLFSYVTNKKWVFKAATPTKTAFLVQMFAFFSGRFITLVIEETIIFIFITLLDYNAVVNYTDAETPYTRIIEHKHFEFGTQPKTVITREYPADWKEGMEAYYPVNDEKNNALFEEYKKLAEKEENVIFGGRLGDYKYYDMDKVVAAALDRLEEFN